MALQARRDKNEGNEAAAGVDRSLARMCTIDENKFEDQRVFSTEVFAFLWLTARGSAMHQEEARVSSRKVM